MNFISFVLKYKLKSKMDNFKTLPVKPVIKFSDLEKLDIRVGTIEKVKDVEKSDKLVRLMVNFGEFTRTILVGRYE